MRVVLRPQAEVDLAEAQRWYEAERLELGDRFRRTVFTVIDQIERFPESAPKVHSDVRRAVLPSFPYSVFYVVDGSHIVVLRVLHSASNPGDWP